MEQPLGAGEWLVTGYIACGCGSLPSGDHTKNYGKSPCLLGKSFFFLMAIFNSKLFVYQRVLIRYDRPHGEESGR